ncbi:HutD/Ves family protein [Ferrovibrio sp.]|uniref:HutD/Ves family protein n=1 Tax=Ferrovibrio sp. TaxID=1917215 RepID=UPI003D2AE9F8
MLIIPVPKQRAMPWKNGKGVSWHIAGFPDGADLESFDWRVSRAAIVRDAPFSAFPGCDRWITLIQGEGFSLRFHNGEALILRRPAMPMQFDGDLEADCKLAAGPATVVNVIVRRGRCDVDVAVVAAPPEMPADVGDAARDGNTVLVRLDGARVLRARFS